MAAHDVAFAVAEETDSDLIIVGEPNRKAASKSGWITDSNTDVAVYFRNRSIEVKSIRKIAGCINIELKQCSLYCCYISPNVSTSQFMDYIDAVLEQARHNSKALIMGDLNSKSVEWGSPYTDRRGIYLTEHIAASNLVTLNHGDTPTFMRGEYQSYIDVTIATQSTASEVTDWKVLDTETLSDHRHILIETTWKTSSQPRYGHKSILYQSILKEEIRTSFAAENVLYMSFDEYTETIRRISQKCQVRREDDQRLRLYWWNSDIEQMRKECLKMRRHITREVKRRRLSNQAREEMNTSYRELKRLLRNLIRRAKLKAWKDLCDELDEDIWGDGYKIAMKSLGALRTTYQLTDQQKVIIAQDLFPSRNETRESITSVQVVRPFTEDELIGAGCRLKPKKAPGPDGVLPEVTKELTISATEVTLRIMNDLLAQQKFPKQWKEARLVLLPKPRKCTDDPVTYRPICLLSTPGKLYESMVLDRLNKEIDEGEGLSERQYGFRKGRSTVQAVEYVTRTARECRKRWCALVALDIKNAFNTASWTQIIRELRRRNISQYLINLISSYFEDRTIKISNKTSMTVTTGVPQGSVMGPTLWNVLYDGILRLELPNDVVSVAFADDLVIMAAAESEQTLMRTINESLRRLDAWLTSRDLELAPQKTESIILKGPRKGREGIVFNLRSVPIVPSKTLKYLGITLDERLTYGEHIKATISKAERCVTALSRIMPNVGGPGSHKRQLLYTVVQSTLLYGAPVWKKAMDTKLHSSKMLRIQRKMLLRVTSAYRTTSAEALQVISGTIPIDLLAEERWRLFNSIDSNTPLVRKAAREETISNWQRRWENNTTNAQWTKRLIPSISRWLKCKHRVLDYHLTQLLTGHGCFELYAKRFGKASDDTCLYCLQADSPEHTLLHCVRWRGVREEVIETLGIPFTLDNLTDIMTQHPRHWTLIRNMAKTIMSRKETDKRSQKQ
nr:unnamed protein product [Callosobruchus analis]